MLRAAATMQDGRRLVMLGLTAENVARLQDDQPIRVDLQEFGVDALVLLFAGENEEEMAKQFLPYIGADTQVTVDPRLFGGGD